MLMFLLATVLSHNLTPGTLAVDANGQPLTTAMVCSTHWSDVRRQLTEKQKAQVFARYHIPLADRHLFVIDHLISLQLGGADSDLNNVWPQEVQESYRKDAVETQLHKLVCGTFVVPGVTLSLEQAQERIRNNWRTALVFTGQGN